MDVADLHLPNLVTSPRLGLRPGESDPAVMLGRVLVLLAALALMTALAWWLA